MSPTRSASNRKATDNFPGLYITSAWNPIDSRLLRVQDSSNVSFTEGLQHKIPPYAIPSLTREVDSQEAVFNDISGRIAQTKNDYEKNSFCYNRSLRTGCSVYRLTSWCINQDSDVELTRSINSTYRLYRNANKCHVHLLDSLTN
ncbi:hypothetical protein F4861DRAFT_9893 [Xylaria intraflava]|nr:hypothetical protein F4861DRAFT_9893 [Xylaria intraflava]